MVQYTYTSPVINSPFVRFRGFVRYKRRVNAYRPAKKRLRDWNEIYSHPKEKELKVQTARSVSYLVVIIVRGLTNTNSVIR